MIISPTFADLDTIKVPSPRINLKRDHFTRKIVFPAAFVSGDILVFGGVIKVTIDYNVENPTQKKNVAACRHLHEHKLDVFHCLPCTKVVQYHGVCLTFI